MAVDTSGLAYADAVAQTSQSQYRDCKANQSGQCMDAVASGSNFSMIFAKHKSCIALSVFLHWDHPD
jgi:hypothetical protein